MRPTNRWSRRANARGSAVALDGHSKRRMNMTSTQIWGLVLAAIVVAGGLVFWARRTPEAPRVATQSVDVVIDDQTLNGSDVFALIEPVWSAVDIYKSWNEYKATLRPFSESQRHLFAIQWYRSEVNNGGHDQFFFNSTGIVWEHAVQGFEAIGLTEGADILRTASGRIGGAARDRFERQAQLERANADFEDLDSRFYRLDESGELDRKMLAFARQHPTDFYFKGRVKRLVLPAGTP